MVSPLVGLRPSRLNPLVLVLISSPRKTESLKKRPEKSIPKNDVDDIAGEVTEFKSAFAVKKKFNERRANAQSSHLKNIMNGV